MDLRSDHAAKGSSCKTVGRARGHFSSDLLTFLVPICMLFYAAKALHSDKGMVVVEHSNSWVRVARVAFE